MAKSSSVSSVDIQWIYDVSTYYSKFTLKNINKAFNP